MRLTILLLCATACATSWRAPVPPTTEACRLEAPPPLPRVELHDCGEGWVGCLDVEGGLALEAYLRSSQRWMQEAWERCHPSG